ncbi:T9SS type A sorting domain-containing protein [Pollutibacter soli]|uniref:T9SS type A sorting domain-containing protein n=1 Tax=Pollutibacter soli TaxID=3034157 RepID=UPI0030137A0C
MTYTVSMAQPEVSGSFHNLSKPQGGPVSNGDIIEIRSVISVPKNVTITRLQFSDIIPAGTTYVPNSMKVMTNEAVYGAPVTNTGVYTDLAGDDAATFISGNTIHINLGDAAGTGTGNTSGGNVVGGVTVPRFQDRATILQAAYRVQVTAAANQTVQLAGSFSYRDAGSVDRTRPVPARIITILPELYCSGVGFSNFILDENGGTFSNGTNHDRGASVNTFDFSYTPVQMYNPDDGEYSITKNSSPTQFTALNPVVTDKVFGIWDIIGDHTGTFSATGNPPAANGAAGGYMLLVNASYAPSAIFSTTVNNLIPGMIYTLSFWVRNICPLCGYDPVTGNPVFAAGVKPNLAFSVNGEDLYTTGDIDYTGAWVQKSFTFSLGSLTSANITIKNNAPGGGGNDWTLDDITISSCIALLPVSIENFEAQPQQNQVGLRWTAVNEQPINSYAIEFSEDGRVFQQAGEVKARGNKAEYSFVHNRKPTATNFYRLRYTDLNGRILFSNILRVYGESKEEQSFTLVQDPNQQMPRVDVYSRAADQLEIRVVDVSGKSVATSRKTVSSGYSVLQLNNIGNFSSGIYFVHIKTSRKSTVLRCLIR